MNVKRLVLAVPAVFLAVWLTDFLVHGIWLENDYAATMDMWRSETEMLSYMGWLILGQFIASAVFVYLWAKGFAPATLKWACCFGILMALFAQRATFVTYAVQPLPGALAAKWCVAALVQGALMGAIVYFVYKPAQPPN